MLYVTWHSALRFDKEHTEHRQKYGISIQIFFHDLSKQIQRHLDLKNTVTVYQHIFM